MLGARCGRPGGVQTLRDHSDGQCKVAIGELTSAKISAPYTFKTGPYSSHTLLLRSLPSDGAGRRVLDVFSGTGGFGIAALVKGGAESAVAVDSSKTSLARLAENAALNGVTRQLETLLRRLPAQWIFAWTYNGLIPHAKLMRSIERFATEVLPRVTTAARD